MNYFTNFFCAYIFFGVKLKVLFWRFNILNILFLLFYFLINFNDIILWGLGIGDWGLGIGDWGLGPIPNPQSPIPNPQLNK